MHHPVPRRLSNTMALLAVVTSMAACSFDEAELLGPDTEQVQAEPGQLRVLSAPDDPTEGDRWIDVATPDDGVYVEGDEFREDGSRTAAADEPAQRRRLFTAVGTGRTLLVELNCTDCRDGIPATDVDGTGLHVWDLVVGDRGQPFSAGTDIAHPDTPEALAPGEYLVVVRPGDEGRADAALDSAGRLPLRLVASHTPDDGADLYVDVYVAVGTGDATVTYRTGDIVRTYRVRVR